MNFSSHIYGVNEVMFLRFFFQLLTHIFKTLPLFSNLYTQIQELHTQNASHLLQNEALHSKYHKHISKANIYKHLCHNITAFSQSLWCISWIILKFAKKYVHFSKQFVQIAPHNGLHAKADNLLKIFSSSLKNKYFHFFSIANKHLPILKVLFLNS